MQKKGKEQEFAMKNYIIAWILVFSGIYSSSAYSLELLKKILSIFKTDRSAQQEINYSKQQITNFETSNIPNKIEIELDEKIKSMKLIKHYPEPTPIKTIIIMTQPHNKQIIYYRDGTIHESEYDEASNSVLISHLN